MKSALITKIKLHRAVMQGMSNSEALESVRGYLKTKTVSELQEIHNQETGKTYLETGKKLAEVLLLKKKSNGRYDTSWGDKTPVGLYLTVKRILVEVKYREEEEI